MKDKRSLNWNDVKQIIKFKTFYVVVILSLIGIICLFLEYFIFSHIQNFIFKGTFSALGITFLTSSTVSIIMEIFLRLDIIDFMTERLLSLVPKDITGNTGVSEFYYDRKRIDFKNYWKESKNFVKIIGVSANDVLSSANLPLIKAKLEEDKNFTIQILLLSPWSITAKLRSEAKVYKTQNEGIIKTHAVIVDIQNFCENLNVCGIDMSRITLKLYDAIPSISMVIDSRFAIVAPFMVVEQGGSSPYYIAENLEIDKSIYNLYCQHFDTIWEMSTVINEETILEDIYVLQKEMDRQRYKNIPNTYNDWLLEINQVHKRS